MSARPPRGAGPSRGRGHGRGRPKSITNSRKRKVAAADSDYEEPSAPKENGRKKKKLSNGEATAAVDPPFSEAEPLERPKRENAGKNPHRVPLPIKSTRRSHEEVLADTAKQEARQAEEVAALALERQARIAEIAALDAAIDKVKAEGAASMVLTLDDQAAAEDTMDTESNADNDATLVITQEDFDRIEDEDAYVSQNEFDKPKASPFHAKPLKKAPKKAPKPAKGQTRAEVEALANTLTEQDGGVASSKEGKKKQVQNSNGAAMSKKAGVSQRWIQSGVKKAPDATPPPSPKLGGLDDDAAAAVRPESSKKIVRRNETVSIDLSGSSDAEDTPSKVPEWPIKALPKRKPRVVIVKPEPENKLAALRVKPTPKIKSESSGSFNFTPPSHADVKGLPAFIGTTWSSKYLPAVYQALNRISDPMHFATIGIDVDNPGKETVAVLQEVLDRLYPGSDWTMKWGDVICTKAVARLGERRGAFGRAALKAVDDRFQHTKYYTPLDGANPGRRLLDVMHVDAKYALRFNGPALFKTPTPLDCKLGPADVGYVKPVGFLESGVFIATVKPYIKGGNYRITFTHEGKIDMSELPVGALAMGAVAVERGYRLYATGDRTTNAVPDFSASNYATAAAGYVKSMARFTETRWDSILKSCGANVLQQVAETPQGDTGLDGFRELMYTPSSP